MPRQRGAQPNNTNAVRYGFNNRRLKQIYRHMKHRCNNPASAQFPIYGGRGIKVCQEWLDSPQAFYDWAFANGYSDNLTIDRIDTNGNYEPSNCRWANRKTQANNRRSTKMLCLNGETRSLSQWADYFGLEYKLVADRYYKKHWPIEKLFIKKRGT